MNVRGKNLIDINKQIEENINSIPNNNETIISTEMNEFTLNYLKSCGVISIANKPTIINNNLFNFQIIINREKNSIPTEYVKYEIYKKKGENSNDNSTSNKN